MTSFLHRVTHAPVHALPTYIVIRISGVHDCRPHGPLERNYYSRSQATPQSPGWYGKETRNQPRECCAFEKANVWLPQRKKLQTYTCNYSRVTVHFVFFGFSYSQIFIDVM